VQFACQIDEVPAARGLPRKDLRRLDRGAQLALVAAADALAQAGELTQEPDRRAVIVGTGLGGLSSFDAEAELYRTKGLGRVNPFAVPATMPNAAAAHLSRFFGAEGPALTVTSACAAGGVALGEALRVVSTGEADVVLAGGTEAPLSEMTFAAFTRTEAMSRRNDDPAAASRPFDADRDGFVMGEGAGFFVLEAWEHALARGAPIIGEVLGYGHTSDAYHIVAPRPDGLVASRAMRIAIAAAGLHPADIAHVNAHGTSTPVNDEAEATALHQAFGGALPPVTSVKGTIGHLLGAAGAVEAAVALVSANRGVVTPVANHETLDPMIELDVVAKAPRLVEPGPALSNSFAFGGHNVSLVLGPGPADPIDP
jgi:3-oxoacyl-[acyl-carrier-protein] synthase II